MGTLATFDKQPAEVQDYDIDFATSYLADINDTVLSFVVVADPGITVVSSQNNAGVIKVWISGGIDGTKYHVTARITTTGGRVHEGDITIRVKEL